MVRLKGGYEKRKPLNKMLFGSCFMTEENKIKEMKAKSIKIEGFQYSLVTNFEVTQAFEHSEPTPKEVKYVFPNDLKICIYETTFVVGDEIIKKQIQTKIEAEETYDDATKQGLTAIFGTNTGSGLTEFKLGNLPPNTECKVILKLAFTGQISSEKVFFIKFPLDVYTPSGSVHSLYSKSSDFSFTVQGDREKIERISSSFEGFEFNEETKLFSIKKSEENEITENSIVVTFEFSENIESSALLSTLANANYDCCAVTISPNLPPKEVIYSEFIFVVDCSGSMGGTSIQRASECLEFFIKSLPPDSYFNFIRFGSFFEKLFDESVEYNEANAEHAIDVAQKLSAEFGGTNIYSPLESIFNEEIKHGQRQIFIITDGEVNNVEQVFELVSNNSNDNRCFTIGLGRFCDAGLVEGLARLSSGKSDFVNENDSISEKVIPQLKASFYPSFINIEVHVENNESFEVSPFPIRPVNSNGSEIVYLCTEKKQKSFEGGIVIEGKYGDDSIEIPIENIQTIENVAEDASGCSGGRNIGKAILPLFVFNMIRAFEMKENVSEDEKRRVIDMSLSSGVLCKYTGYVGMKSQTLFDYSSGTARNSTGGRAPSIKAAQRCDVHVEKTSKYDLLALTRYQKITGYWDNLDVINAMLGLDVKQIEGIKISDHELEKCCIATILAVAALRVKSKAEKNSWFLIEQKAINWLNKKLPDVDINQVISNTERLIH